MSEYANVQRGALKLKSSSSSKSSGLSKKVAKQAPVKEQRACGVAVSQSDSLSPRRTTGQRSRPSWNPPTDAPTPRNGTTAFNRSV
jgi:hypothetical protein